MISRLSTAAVLALGLGLVLPAVQAADDGTRIFKTPVGAAEASKSKKFVINPELGRAWVEVDFHYAVSETSDHHRVAVPGLRYDRERSEVVFDADGRRVVCATVQDRGRWVFRHHHIKPTGNCELMHRYIKVPMDDGFYISHIEHFELHFKPSLDHASAS
ncbi:hypothetical protein [Sinimarinibacterium thermocellulolyticum]|jgi:hypothetical protein|uniref:Uncharacterized protein n=1 Tax=Sinimarinibacterium thermocellulolyticum TaxID=3170016 RepID=A0ABV2A8S0_9GAMM